MNEAQQAAAQIKEARSVAGLTQRELADLLDVAERTLQNWEAGVTEPLARHRRRLQAWFDAVEAEAAA